MLKHLFIVSFTLLTILNVYSQSADKVLEDYLEAIGGKTHLENLETIVMSGKSDTAGIEFPVTICQKAPSKSYTEVYVMG